MRDSDTDILECKGCEGEERNKEEGRDRWSEDRNYILPLALTLCCHPQLLSYFIRAGKPSVRVAAREMEERQRYTAVGCFNELPS